MLISTAGTISNERTNHPQSFNLIDIDDGSIVIQKQEVFSKERKIMKEHTIDKGLKAR